MIALVVIGRVDPVSYGCLANKLATGLLSHLPDNCNLGVLLVNSKVLYLKSFVCLIKLKTKFLLLLYFKAE